MLETGGLLEWAEVHGNRYGTPRAAVEAEVAEGRQVILEIDPQGAFQVKSLVPDSVLVFVMPPSLGGAAAPARGARKRDRERRSRPVWRPRNASSSLWGSTIMW